MKLDNEMDKAHQACGPEIRRKILRSTYPRFLRIERHTPAPTVLQKTCILFLSCEDVNYVFEM